MSYVLVEDVPASWERYGSIARSLGRPAGLLLHAAGPTDEGFRIVEIWETEADWRRFSLERALPIESIDPLVDSRTVMRDLHAEHVVVGDALGHLSHTGEEGRPKEGERR